MLRRPLGLAPTEGEPLAGPLKIWLPSVRPTSSRLTRRCSTWSASCENILDAVESARAHENAEVRILEVGHPEQIARALEADAYHVLHLSCHGSPGKLKLEDEEGRPVPTTAKSLITPLKEPGRPLPLGRHTSLLAPQRVWRAGGAGSGGLQREPSPCRFGVWAAPTTLRPAIT